ncbi:MAG: adenylyl-sulfate kinase [Sphingobacteriales bacterium]|nr:MAG: adenylyl-sulfate kinase [Sphingobacteriales bacterium]
MSSSNNIHPIFHRILQRSEKEQLLNQTARVIWLTGLSGSGKSTIAEGLEKKLHENNFLTQILDGDNIRAGINSNLGFSETDRLENIRRIAEVSKLFLNCSVITINSFVSPTNDVRKLAKEIISENDFIEIYVNCPIEICEQRDVKGLYAKARRGEIKDFTGITAPFEAPVAPSLEIKSNELTIEESVEKIFNFILPFITKK